MTSIRKASRKDIPSINALAKEMHMDLGRLANKRFSRKELEEERITAKEIRKALVSEINGKVIGFISFSVHKDDEWYGNHVYINEFAVKKEFRGKGIGKMLIEKIFSIAKLKKLNVKVDTLANNKRTIEFYKKLGFKPFMVYFKK